MNQKRQGLSRIIHAFFYSMKGFKAAFRSEAAFRQELYVAIVLMPIALWVSDSTVERLVLIGSLVLVLIVELLNSAIEAVVDRVGTEHNELSGKAKDIASAAVFLSIVLSTLCWLVVLFS